MIGKKLAELRGLGPKSESMLSSVGIHTEEDLRTVGAVEAYLRVRDQTEFNPGMNLLYAMVGALENRSWKEIAREERFVLLMTLDGHERLTELLLESGAGS